MKLRIVKVNKGNYKGQFYIEKRLSFWGIPLWWWPIEDKDCLHKEDYIYIIKPTRYFLKLSYAEDYIKYLVQEEEEKLADKNKPKTTIMRTIET